MTISGTVVPVLSVSLEAGEAEPIIVCDGVYKRFARNEQRSLRHEASAIFRGLFRHSADGVVPFYALQDVSFTVRHGESVAIIGRNGSGKTTLLRVLAGITRPTVGHVQVNGRFGALIALGAGFKHDLTGRKNIYLNAAIHGVPPAQVDQIIDDIIDFAELRDFIDLPINRYSSGMAARLGFSIMVHILPDVVFIDEVLSVGDVAFQEKCTARIMEMKAKGGTIVFVSHSETTVRKLCERAIWLHQGKVMKDGLTDDVMSAYSAFLGVPR
jgi:ABC-type polysaccharide/polyol phosphate transport system ATPase subunit